MSNQQFSFPPPPPPPPHANSFYSQPPDPSQAGFNDRYSRGGTGHHGRGRGNIRGAPRGGYAGNLGHASGYGGYPHGDQRGGYGPSNQANHYGGGSYPLPEYPSAQQPSYPPSVHHAYNPPAPQYPPSQPYPSPQYQPYPSYPPSGHQNTSPYNVQPQNQQDRYGSPSHSGQPRYKGRTRQPIMMGPPIHIGPDGRPTDYQSPPYASHYPQEVNRLPLGNHPPHSSGSARHGSPKPYPGRGKKRNRSEAFHQPNQSQFRPQAAPAVPSFGNPLPVDLPTKLPEYGANGKKKKKKRRHNQLGLTPRTEEHESSEDEDDQDEEAKLAAATSGQLQFTFKGQTSTLQSASEIAKWIEERKKRFPTKARAAEAAEAAERKKQNQEEQRAARQAAKESQEKRRTEARAKQDKHRAEASLTLAQAASIADDPSAEATQDAKAAKAQSKLEKLRRRLEKEERRIAKAQAKASKADTEPGMAADPQILSATKLEQESTKSLDVPETSNDIEVEMSSKKDANGLKSDPSGSVEPNIMGKDVGLPPEDLPEFIVVEQPTAPNPLTPTSQPSIPDGESKAASDELSTNELLPSSVSIQEVSEHPPESKEPESEAESNLSMSSSSSDITSSSEEDDETSSSGASSSSDDAPEAATSRRTAPDKVPPPKRERPKSNEICRYFLRNGRCPRGDGCKFRHELPAKGQRSKAERRSKADERKTERKSLHQRLVEKEKEQEDEQILRAIVSLGDRGFLTEPAPEGQENDAKVP